jgi:membrane-associated phospholipid phosphatase
VTERIELGSGGAASLPRGESPRRVRHVLAAAAYAAALALCLAVPALEPTPRRYLLVLLAPALVLRSARRYLFDFIPFAFLIVIYAQCRALAHVLRPDPYYLPQLDAERWLFGGHVPSATLQEWLWTGSERWYDHALVLVTGIHAYVPITLAFLLWLRRRALFYSFAASVLTASFAAAIVFLVYPAAPPWAAARAGLLETTRIGGDAGGDANPYAAIPSLHAGYAFLVFLMLAALAWRSRYRGVVLATAAVYPLLQSFAVVYTGNHYVVDLLAGYAVAAAAFFGVATLWRRLGLPR